MKRSLRLRIMLMILCLLAFTLLLTLLVFNWAMRRYVADSVKDQLEITSAMVRNYQPPVILYEPDISWLIPSLTHQPRNPIGARAQLFAINGRYQVVAPLLADEDSAARINAVAARMQQDQLDLGRGDKHYMETPAGAFYVTSVVLEAVAFRQEYLVLYADVTGIMNFSKYVNMLLMTVIALSGGLGLILAGLWSGSVVRPIRLLGDFARSIGSADFQTRRYHFKDEELSELLDAMNHMAEQLERYDKDQKTFYQNVSHELRTPLMAIRCHAEGIEHGIMNAADSSAVIITEADRLSALVEDLLYISRMDNITNDYVLQECDLREVLSNCAQRQAVLAQKNGVAFVFDFDSSPVVVNGSETQLERAFSNLIANALRYARRQIILRCRQGAKGVEVEVADDGAGIDPNILPHIFERFYKGERGHFGIGLAIVKSVAETHRGVITVDTAADMGTRIRIEFPDTTA
jgi:signal transduction histidine kinase